MKNWDKRRGPSDESFAQVAAHYGYTVRRVTTEGEEK